MKKILRLMSVILTITVLLSVVSTATPVLAAEVQTASAEASLHTEAETEDSDTESATGSEAVHILGEDKSRRDENTKHFIMSDGSRKAVIYSEPVHYRENGKWTDIDNTLEYDSKNKEYKNKQNSFDVKFKDNFRNDDFFTIENQGYTLSWEYSKNSLSKLFVNGEVAEIAEPKDRDEKHTHKPNGKITYNNFESNCELEYVVTSTGVKENIILNQKTDKNEFSFKVTAYGLTLVKNADGSISAKTAEDEEIFYIPAPFMYDSKNAYSDKVSYALKENNNGTYTVTVTADKEWLNATEREYPVTIDPAIQTKRTLTAIDATFVASGNPEQNFNGREDIYIGVESANYLICRALFEFDLPVLKKGDIVVGGSLFLAQHSSDFYADTMPNQQIDAHIVTGNWNASTVTWATRPNFQETILDYSFIKRNVNEWKTFDITKAVKGWYEGTYTNNGIMIKKAVEEGSYADVAARGIFCSDINGGATKNFPYIEIDYRNNKGLEEYWSYSSFGAGATIGSVNDYSGNLVYQIPLVSSVSEIMPVSISLVYNTYAAGIKYLSGKNSSYLTTPGKGWKLNIQETVLTSDLYGLTGDALEKYPYVYTDGDGTEHYFEKVTKTDEDGKEVITYEDEDGLGLTLDDVATDTYRYKITDKQDTQRLFSSKGNLGIIQDSNGNKIKIHFNDDKTKIVKVTDGTGHTFDFTYYTPKGGEETNYLQIITDNAGRKTNLHFDHGYLKNAYYYDGSSVSVVYEAEDDIAKDDFEGLINYVLTSDGNGVNFDYTSKATGRRVRKVMELGTTSAGELTGGQAVTFDRTEYNTTVIRSGGIDSIPYDPITDEYKAATQAYKNDDIITTLQFSNFGTPVSQQVTYGDGSEVGAGAYNYGDKTEGSNNKITDAASLGKNTVNLVKNGNAETLDNWSQVTSGTLTTTKEISPDFQYTGNNSLMINNTAIETNGANSYFRQSILGTYETGDFYTFSAFVKTSNIVQKGSTGYKGAYIQIVAYDANNTNLQYKQSQLLISDTATGINNGWRRLSATIEIPTGTTRLAVYLCLRNATGKAYFDCMQLECSEVPNSVNLLENSSFENKNSNDTPALWTTAGNCDILKDKVKTIDTKNGTNALVIYGGADVSKGYCQQIPVQGNESDTYIVSGWAKADAVNSTYHSHYEKNGVTITHEAASDILSNTNKDDDKQLELVEDSKFEIAVRVTYKKTDAEKNTSIVTQFKEPAKFNTTISEWQYAVAPISLKYTDGESGCTYTPTYILIMPRYNKQANQAYFDHIQLIKDVAQSYVYDDEGNLVSVTANAEQKNNMTYDGEDNLVEYKDAINCTTSFAYQEKTHNLISVTSPKGVKTAYTYNSKGQVTSSEAQNASNNRKITTGTSYTAASDGISAGAYVSYVSDEHGYKTIYTYDMKTGTPLTVKDANGTVTTNTYTDTKFSKLDTVSVGGSKVDYGYDGNRIDTIHFGTNTLNEKYSFAYDEFGNVLQTKVGNVALSTNTYGGRNGVLKQSLYNNGDGIKYNRNNSGLVTDQYKKDDTSGFNETASYSWAYSVNGTPRTHTDDENKLKYIYSYDSIGRLIRQDISNSETNAIVGSTEFGYNSRGHQTSIKNEIGGRVQAQYYSYSKITDANGNVINDSYNNGKDGLPTRYQIASNRYADYSYDSLNRLNLRSFSTKRPLYNNYLYKISARDTGTDVYRTNQLYVEIIDNTAYRYTYDKMGNITQIEKGERATKDSSNTAVSSYTQICTYEYDALGQLIRENNVADNKTYAWKYDCLGNIEVAWVYKYSTGKLGELISAIDYQYTKDSETGWNNLLTTVIYKTYTYDEENPNGKPNIVKTETINYDTIGNPTDYGEAEIDWFGRQMTSYSKGNVSATFTYDADGLRGSKTVNNAKTTYFYVGDKLMYECRPDGIELYFYYDSYDNLSVIQYVKVNDDGKDDSYFFYVTTNMQGDVLGIYSADGDLKASYEYDAWGNATVYAVTQNSAGENVYTQITNQATSTNIGAINPIRYRGYYFDVETGFYYLQSRYYCPKIGRFLNADGYITTGQGVLSYNMFAYCMNNPVMCSDYTGYASIFAVFKKVVNNVTTIIKSNSIKTFFVDLLECITSPKAHGNTCSIGYTYGYTSGGVSGNKSKTISSDTSYNYAIQETESSGAGTGGGGSFGLTFSFTNANNVNDLNGESQSWGGSFAGPIGISVEYTEFVPVSNPQGKCYGFGFAISVGGEAEIHKYTNKTEMIEFYQPLVSLKEKLYG